MTGVQRRLAAKGCAACVALERKRYNYCLHSFCVPFTNSSSVSSITIMELLTFPVQILPVLRT